MELAFTPKGQSADENILERVEALKNRKSATVVTNDLGLKRQAGAFGAKTMSNDEFLDWLLKRAAKRKRKQATTKESPQEIERLTKIFEQRLKDDQ
jgi:predicted RNA-binding protein with PIN domain